MTRAVACALVCAALVASAGTDAHAKRRLRSQAADTTRVALPDPVLAPDLPRALAVLDSARAAAAADRHADAIRLYKRAIKFYPPLADQIGVELGNQYTWSDEPDSAMTWYRYHLSRHPDDVDARIGVARLTSWRDDLDEARRQYEAVLAADSTNLDARMGHAQVVNWSGRHREAESLYRGIIEDHPDEMEARAGLMQALRWMGRADQAVAIADSTPDPGLGAIATDIRHSVAPGVSYRYEQNEDSDDIRRWYHTVGVGFSPGLLTRVGVQYDHARFEQPARPEVDRDAVSLVLERRFSATLAAHASVGREWNTFDQNPVRPETDFVLTILDIYATITPRDWMRIDIGAARESIDNPDAIFRGISRTVASAGLDLRLRSNLLWVSSFDAGWYSDDNSAIGLGTRMVWDPLWRLPMRLTHRFTSSTGFAYYGFDRTTDNGYYDPRQYLSFYEELAFAIELSETVNARIAGRISIDRENGDDWFPTGRFEASASWTIWHGLGVSAGYTNANSRLDARPGYEIDGFYVTVDWLFW